MARGTPLSHAVAGLLAVGWLAIALLLVLGTLGRAEAIEASAWLAPALVALLTAGLTLATALRGSSPGGRREAASVLLGSAALVLVVPLLFLLLEPALGGMFVARNTPSGVVATRPSGVPLPSPEVLYAGLLALMLTALQAALLLGSSRRTAAGLVAVPVLAALLLGAFPVVAARDAAAPAGCQAPVASSQAEVTMAAEARIDGRLVGTAWLKGERAGDDARWQGQATSELVDGFAVEFTRAGDARWLRLDGGEWFRLDVRNEPASGSGEGGVLDLGVAAMLTARSLSGAENLGLETFEGVPARHCRLMIDGTTALRLLPPARWLIAGGPLAADGRLDIWRGELDWWVAAGGRLVHVQLLVGGHPADAWGRRALRGELRGHLLVHAPAAPLTIDEPLP